MALFYLPANIQIQEEQLQNLGCTQLTERPVYEAMQLKTSDPGKMLHYQELQRYLKEP